MPTRYSWTRIMVRSPGQRWSATRLRRGNLGLCPLGVEIDRDRVAAAQPSAGHLTRFRLSGAALTNTAS